MHKKIFSVVNYTKEDIEELIAQDLAKHKLAIAQSVPETDPRAQLEALEGVRSRKPRKNMPPVKWSISGKEPTVSVCAEALTEPAIVDEQTSPDAAERMLEKLTTLVELFSTPQDPQDVAPRVPKATEVILDQTEEEAVKELKKMREAMDANNKMYGFEPATVSYRDR